MCGFPTSRTRSPGGASILRPIPVAACRPPPPPAALLPAAARGPSVAAPPSPGPFWPSLPPLKISRTVSLASMIVRSAVKRSTYVDSVTLMLVQKEVRQQPGGTEAGLVVATDANPPLRHQLDRLRLESETPSFKGPQGPFGGTSDNAV